MKGFKHIILPILVIFSVSILISETDKLILVLPFFICLLFIYIVSGIFRYKKSFLSYFLSPFSFLHAKVNHTVLIDLPPNLLFEKLLTYYNSINDYKVITYEGLYIINVGTPFSGISWTENIIIQIEPLENGASNVHFTSLAFGFFSWGKNEQNFNELKDYLDGVLVI